MKNSNWELETGYPDSEWYAIDKVGHVAFFTTAGSGFIPDVYESHPAILCESISGAERLSIRGGHTLIAQNNAGVRYADWIDAANKGCYAYDYIPYSQREYMLIAVPENPIVLRECVDKWMCTLAECVGTFGSETMSINGDDVLVWRLRTGG